MDKVDKKIAADVKEHGFHVVKVLGDDEEGPPFAYTIGLELTFDHPEVIIFGLNADLDFMHHILEGIAGRIAKGERFEHGAKKKNILPGYICPFARLPKTAYEDHIGRALSFYATQKTKKVKQVRAVQCIWPDPQKRLPWDKKAMLPILGREPVFLRPDAGPRDPAWPFQDPHSHYAITSRQVAIGQEPIRYAGRFEDGTYQFVCGTTEAEEDIVMTTLGWALDRDPTLSRAGKLAKGEALKRDDAKSSWKKTLVTDED